MARDGGGRGDWAVWVHLTLAHNLSNAMYTFISFLTMALFLSFINVITFSSDDWEADTFNVFLI